jgi:protein-tyrosine-phosphatase
MAEGFLKSFDLNLEVFSAGTHPAEKVNPFAVKVMKEVGIDLSNRRPKNVSEFLNQSFDYVITVCDNAKETCPVFVGQVKHRVHLSFEDPAEARKAGCSLEEIQQAVELSKMVKQRPIDDIDKLASDLIERERAVTRV